MTTPNTPAYPRPFIRLVDLPLGVYQCRVVSNVLKIAETRTKIAETRTRGTVRFRELIVCVDGWPEIRFVHTEPENWPDILGPAALCVHKSELGNGSPRATIYASR